MSACLFVCPCSRASWVTRVLGGPDFAYLKVIDMYISIRAEHSQTENKTKSVAVLLTHLDKDNYAASTCSLNGNSEIITLIGQVMVALFTMHSRALAGTAGLFWLQ